ncbi:MAG: hypothetical protein AAFQ55_06820 [Pseudomonadota bacterium]
MKQPWPEAETSDHTEIISFFAASDLQWTALLVVLSTLLFWLIALVIRTLLAEYVKRFWFQRVDRRDIKEAKAALAKAVEDIELEQAELAALKASTTDLIRVNDQLLRENIRLRALASNTHKAGEGDPASRPHPWEQ